MKRPVGESLLTARAVRKTTPLHVPPTRSYAVWLIRHDYWTSQGAGSSRTTQVETFLSSPHCLRSLTSVELVLHIWVVSQHWLSMEPQGCEAVLNNTDTAAHIQSVANDRSVVSKTRPRYAIISSMGDAIPNTEDPSLLANSSIFNLHIEHRCLFETSSVATKNKCSCAAAAMSSAQSIQHHRYQAYTTSSAHHTDYNSYSLQMLWT